MYTPSVRYTQGTYSCDIYYGILLSVGAGISALIFVSLKSDEINDKLGLSDDGKEVVKKILSDISEVCLCVDYCIVTWTSIKFGETDNLLARFKI